MQLTLYFTLVREIFVGLEPAPQRKGPVQGQVLGSSYLEAVPGE